MLELTQQLTTSAQPRAACRRAARLHERKRLTLAWKRSTVWQWRRVGKAPFEVHFYPGISKLVIVGVKN
jgi:hypothetical protein